jgi:hypothetical protein
MAIQVPFNSKHITSLIKEAREISRFACYRQRFKTIYVEDVEGLENFAAIKSWAVLGQSQDFLRA